MTVSAAASITVEVITKAGLRVGALTGRDLNVELTKRYCKGGAWRVTVRADHSLAPYLVPGSGIVVYVGGNRNTPWFTGLATDPQTVVDAKAGKMVVVDGTTDDVIVRNVLALGNPTAGLASAAVPEDVYDDFEGVAETAIIHYLNANVGATAHADRKIANLTVDASLGRGVTVTKRADDHKTLGSLLDEIGNYARLDWRVFRYNVSGTWTFRATVVAPVDRTDTVRLDVTTGDLTKSTLSQQPAGTTHVLVRGPASAEPGSGTTQRLVTTPESLAAASLWGWRTEKLLTSSDPAASAFDQTGKDELVVRGYSEPTVNAVVSEATAFTSTGLAFDVGDIVAVITGPGVEVDLRVTDMTLKVSSKGVGVAVTLGRIPPRDQSLLDDIKQVVSNTTNNTNNTYNSGGTPDPYVPPARQSFNVAVPAGTFELALAKGYRLQQVASSAPADVRLYRTSAQRASDAARPVTSDPDQTKNHGLVLEVAFASGLGTIDLTPQVDGSCPSGNTVYGLSSAPAELTITWLQTE